MDRTIEDNPEHNYLSSLPIVRISEQTQTDLEQIASGAFSSLTGFMVQGDFLSVLDNMRLQNGAIF